MVVDTIAVLDTTEMAVVRVKVACTMVFILVVVDASVVNTIVELGVEGVVKDIAPDVRVVRIVCVVLKIVVIGVMIALEEIVVVDTIEVLNAVIVLNAIAVVVATAVVGTAVASSVSV